jgi:hypothetical protein
LTRQVSEAQAKGEVKVLDDQFEADVQAEIYRLRVVAEARRRWLEEQPPTVAPEMIDKVVEFVNRHAAGVSRSFVASSILGNQRDITLALEAAADQGRIRRMEGGPVKSQVLTYLPLLGEPSGGVEW